jgi:hypothetical protein
MKLRRMGPGYTNKGLQKSKGRFFMGRMGNLLPMSLTIYSEMMDGEMNILSII